MKICYLADAGSIHTKKWVKFFSQKGYEIVVISLRDGDIPNCKVYSLGIDSAHLNNDLKKLLHYTKQISMVKKILKDEKPDIVHAHYATSYGILVAQTKIHPYILTIWGSDIYEFPQKSFLHKAFIKYNLKSADIVTTLSKSMKKEIGKYVDKDVLLTPFGVDTEVFKKFREDRLSKFTVGTIKAFYPKYGIKYLIKGYKKFLDITKEEDTRLLLGGRGEEEQELKDLVKELKIEDKVQFLGFLNGEEEIVKVFNKIDVAVIPSLQEGFGVSAIEAQSCELPTIVTNVGGLPEATKPGETSIVVEPENADQIADSLVDLYMNENKRKEMGNNARKYVLNNFDINDNFNSVDKYYKEIVSSNRNKEQ